MMMYSLTTPNKQIIMRRCLYYIAFGVIVVVVSAAAHVASTTTTNNDHNEMASSSTVQLLRWDHRPVGRSTNNVMQDMEQQQHQHSRKETNNNIKRLIQTMDHVSPKNNIPNCCAGCQSDDDCMDGLVCMKRPYPTNPPVPGCSGLRLKTAGYNFCYNPHYDTVHSSMKSDPTICLYQEDFTYGTVQITQPGYYKLCENITFCPNAPLPNSTDIPDNAFDPILPSKKYDGHGFALGFFAAIAISANDTTIDLNTYTIDQCTGHALMQRFFSIIELAASPFIKNVGPHKFVSPNGTFHCANNVVIKGPGRMGLSSHHAIHGNENINVTIRDIIFEKFEVAAISLNKVNGLVIENNDVLGNRKDIPVIGMFSAARFIRPYIKYLSQPNISYSMMLRNQQVTATELYQRLISTINNVYNDVMANGTIDPIKHPIEYELFHNPLQIIDGPCYAFVVHGKGPAINGFGSLFPNTTNMTSSDAIIRHNRIKDYKCFNKEIPAAVENKTVVIDVRGSVFQFYNTFTNKSISYNQTDGGTYTGNIVSDTQIMVAKAIHDGLFNSTQNDPTLLTNLNTIPPSIVTWAEGIPQQSSSNNSSGSTMVIPSYQPNYRCDGDSMHHVAKGIVMIRVEETRGFIIENNTIDEIENLSLPGFTNCTDYHVLADPENANISQIGNLRGISIAATRPFDDSTPSRVQNNLLTNFFSKNAPYIIGIDIQGDTKGVVITDNFVMLNADAKTNSTDHYYAVIVGEHADDAGMNTTIVIQNNTLYHELVLQNTKLQASSRGRFRRNRQLLTNYHHHSSGRDMRLPEEIDVRNFGGCPMGF